MDEHGGVWRVKLQRQGWPSMLEYGIAPFKVVTMQF